MRVYDRSKQEEVLKTIGEFGYPVTSSETAAKLGWSPTATANFIKKLVAAGKLEKSHTGKCAYSGRHATHWVPMERASTSRTDLTLGRDWFAHPDQAAGWIQPPVKLDYYEDLNEETT